MQTHINNYANLFNEDNNYGFDSYHSNGNYYPGNNDTHFGINITKPNLT
jgi:hypothetical protein